MNAHLFGTGWRTASGWGRKFLIILTIVAIAGFFTVGIPHGLALAEEPETLFSDGFEGSFDAWNGADGNWDTSGGNVHSGEQRAEVEGNTDGSDNLTADVSTNDYFNIELSYWYRISDGL